MGNWTLNLVKIKIGDEIVWATCNHPFYVPDIGEWLPALELGPGMNVLGIDLHPRMIDEVRVMATHEDTFNISVADFHTFFVGEVGLLVHNAAFTSLEQAYTEIYLVSNPANQPAYVGRTVQGLDVRWAKHLAKDHQYWVNGYQKPVVLNSGNWTPAEAAIQEQHFIDYYGGTGTLENKYNAISEATYSRVKATMSLNPCG